MGKAHAPLEKHFRQVPQTEFVSEAPQDNQTHHIGRILEPIEGCPAPFVEFPLTCTAAEAPVAQFGALGAFGGSGRLTVEACHEVSPFGEMSLHAAPPKTKMK